MRTVQYDVYGRIDRTEVMMSRKIINMLNRVARRAPTFSSAELHKAMLPIARRLSKQALDPVEKQNLMLPIALDIRFAQMRSADVIELTKKLVETWGPRATSIASARQSVKKSRNWLTSRGLTVWEI